MQELLHLHLLTSLCLHSLRLVESHKPQGKKFFQYVICLVVSLISKMRKFYFYFLLAFLFTEIKPIPLSETYQDRFHV